MEILIIAVLVIGGAAYYFFKPKSEPETEEQRTARNKAQRSYILSQIEMLGAEKLQKMTPTELTDWINARPDCPTKFHLRYIIAIISSNKLKLKGLDATLSYEERQEERKTVRAHGEKNEKITCPHCQTKGFVRVRRGEKRTSIQTTGLGPLNSVLLPKGESKTEVSFLKCDNCEMEWET